MNKILSVLGARPQFVKAAAVSRALKKAGVQEVIIHTGQHFDKNMSDVFFEEMEIPEPDYKLNINSLSHGAMTGRMLEEVEKVIEKEKPDALMVYGDTNSTIAGALAAKKIHVKVIHVEAGLRSFNMEMPEEINRILTDRISDVLFCPTETAVSNLKKEGYDNIDCEIVRNGDVMQDAAMYYAMYSEEKSTVSKHIDLKSDFVLGTIHRQENTDDKTRLKNIVEAFNEIAKQESVIIPLHPRTKKILEKENIKPEFTVIDPVGYFDMIELLKNCTLVMTDSGGLQKEAFFFQKNCVTLRDQTEWIELIDNGFNVLAGADKKLIIDSYTKMKSKSNNFEIDLYGNGQASERIAKYIKDYN